MKIKTNYIKKKIKKRNFDSETDRKYIEDLMYIERLLSMDASKWRFAGAMKLHQLEVEYTEESEAIFKELNPKGYIESVKVKVKQKKEKDDFSESMRKAEAKEMKEFKKLWKDCGGK